MANEIRIDPAAMRRFSEEIGKCHTSLRNSLYSSKAQIETLNGVWTGDAADTFRKSFQTLLDKCAESLETVGKMANVLYDSADSYESSEKAIQQEAAKLPKLPPNTMR